MLPAFPVHVENFGDASRALAAVDSALRKFLRRGEAQFDGGTPATATVLDPDVSDDSTVVLGRRSGAAGIITYVITPGVGFVFTSSVNGDTGYVRWLVVDL